MKYTTGSSPLRRILNTYLPVQLTQQPRSSQRPSRAREPLPGAEQPTVPAALASLGPERQSLCGVALSGPHLLRLLLPEGKGKVTRGHSTPTRDSHALLRRRSFGSREKPTGCLWGELNVTRQNSGKADQFSEKFKDCGGRTKL